jgi:hypothetical protein
VQKAAADAAAASAARTASWVFTATAERAAFAACAPTLAAISVSGSTAAATAITGS